MSDSETVNEENTADVLDKSLVMDEAESDDHAPQAEGIQSPARTVSDDEDSDSIGFSRSKRRVQILSDNSDDEPDECEKEEISPALEGTESDLSNHIPSPTPHEAANEGDVGNSERYRKLRVLCDEESSPEEREDEEMPKVEKQRKQRNKKLSKKRDSQEDRETSEETDEEERELLKKPRKKKKAEKPKKLTKQEKEDEVAKRNEVYSMIQKNAREEVIEVPYHKPEQYDLKEFLSRLQKSKIDLPGDEKLAKKTGKLRGLKVERKMPIRVEEEKDLLKESKEMDEVPKLNAVEAEILDPKECSDEIDMLVAGPSTSKGEPLENRSTPEVPSEASSAKKLILQGDPDTFIDWESGAVHPKSKSKEVSLIEKCILHNAKTSATVDSIRIESSPGVAYKILKESLEQELLRKKREQMQKYLEDQEREKITKIANDIDDEAEFADSDHDHENDEENGKVEKLIESEDETELKDVEEDNASRADECENEDDCGDDAVHVEEEENDEAEDEDSDVESEDSERKKKYRKRIVNMNDEDSDEDDEKNEAFPIPDDGIQLPIVEQNTSVTSITESQMEKDELELLDLCSGNFVTQPAPLTLNFGNAAQEVSQNDDVQAAPNFESSDEENPAQCPKIIKKKVPRVYLSDDEEKDQKDVEELDDTSDCEAKLDDNDELSDPPELSDQEELEECKEAPAKDVEYDSEENEVDLPALPTKSKMKVTDFMENEAELSESEWGSADEDEKDLDKLEVELGDEDQFDQAQLQNELERIHMKKLLDQDAREVKMVKNLVLHEEEREGMIRERTFRWLHVDNDFNLNSSENGQENGQDDARQSDEENEEVWRKIRHERDVVLKDQLQGELSGMFEMGNVTILKPSIPEDPREVKAPTFLVPEQDNFNRKSLLRQDDEYLARLASIASKTSDVLINGATEKGSFVFRQMSKPEDSSNARESLGKRKLANPVAPIKGKKRQKTSIYG